LYKFRSSTLERLTHYY